MTPILTQNNAGSITLYIETSAGLPATGLVDTDVTADIKKPSGAFVAHILTALNWTELSGGFYQVALALTDTDELGNLYLRVQGATIKTALAVALVVVSVPATPPTVTPPGTVTVFGYVYGVDAAPEVGIGVTARILGAPTVLHPGTDGLVIAQDPVQAVTDANGFFTLDLIAGTDVDIFISAASYRRTITVPSVSTNLFDLP